MKVIDLLVDKVNGKQLPNKIKANGIVFILDKDNNEYKREDGNAEEFYTDYMIDGFVDLTNGVEIIEEDKKIEENKGIEGLWISSSGLHSGEMSNGYEEENLKDIVKHNFNVVHNKINEIIDILNEMREDKE